MIGGDKEPRKDLQSIPPLRPAEGSRYKAVAPLPVHNSKTLERLQRQPHLPVPIWATLPDPVKADLETRGFDAAWFARSPDEVRLSVLNLYLKLKALSLWHFVECDAGSNSESLTFTSTDASELKRALKARSDFKGPTTDKSGWQSREYQTEGALHFKHFKGSPLDQVQTHIDGRGKYSSRPVLYGLITLGLATAFQALSHGITYHTFEDPYYIRDLLLGQGFDRATLGPSNSAVSWSLGGGVRQESRGGAGKPQKDAPKGPSGS